MKKSTALVADDVAEIRDLVAMLLRDHDYEIIEAGDGLHALRLAAADRPSVVFIDVEMPGGGAVQHVETLRAILPCARIVAMSAFAPIQVQREVLRLGADVFLDKSDLSVGFSAALGVADVEV